MNKLYRSRKDSKLFGLCGGLAEMLNIDSTLLRVVLLVTTFFTGGSLIPIYFIACLVIPKEPADPFYNSGYGYSNRNDFGPYSSGPARDDRAYYHNEAPRQHYGSGSYSSGYGTKPPVYGPGPGPGPSYGPQPKQPSPQDIDELMRDVEKKALQKELEELRARLAKYENNDK